MVAGAGWPVLIPLVDGRRVQRAFATAQMASAFGLLYAIVILVR
jgi:hypothetical protein